MTQHKEDLADKDIQQLMALAGRRDDPPEDMEARVRAAVMQSFDQLPPANRIPRLLARAASVAAFVTIAYLLLGAPSGTEPVGEIQFSVGTFTLQQSADEEAAATTVLPGATLQTASDGRLQIGLGEHLQLRADGETRLTLVSSSKLYLHQGRIYVDSSNDEQLLVETQHGAITDVGTQFEISVHDEQMTVAIREGAVDIAIGNRLLSTRASDGSGELLRFQGTELDEITAITSTDPHWQWIHGARPEFELADRSVAEFLEWAARESGRKLRYESNLVRQQAEMPRALRGEAAVDSDLASIEQVLRVTRFDLAPARQHELIVRFRPM